MKLSRDEWAIVLQALQARVRRCSEGERKGNDAEFWSEEKRDAQALFSKVLDAGGLELAPPELAVK